MSHSTNAGNDVTRNSYIPTEPLTDAGKLPVMLTTATCAALAGVSRKHICDLLNEGTIRGTKVGAAWRVPRDGFLSFLGLEA